MSIEENKAVVRRYFEGDHDGRDNTELWNELCQPDMTLHASVFPEPVRGLEPLKQMTRAMHGAMSPFAIDIQDMVAEDDRVAVRYTMRGTHTGDFPLPDGSVLPASGQSFSVTGASFVRLRDGKLTEERTELDWGGMMAQIGAAPQG